jgi:carboxyl-terminal processing protease
VCSSDLPHASSIQPVLPELQQLHQMRVADDPDFTYLRAIAKRSHENSRRTHLSLNEEIRTQEKTQDDSWRLALENQLRAAKGEESVESLEALDELREAEQEDEEDKPVDDALLVETGNILLDYLRLSRQIALVENLPVGEQTTVQ